MRRALRILEILFVLVCVIGLLFAVMTVAGFGTDITASSTYPGSYPNCPDSNGYPAYPVYCDSFLPVVLGQ